MIKIEIDSLMLSSSHMSFSMLILVKFTSLSSDMLNLKYVSINFNLKKELSLLATLTGMVSKIHKAIAKLRIGKWL